MSLLDHTPLVRSNRKRMGRAQVALQISNLRVMTRGSDFDLLGIATNEVLTMRLWFLKRVERANYDEASSFVVRAFDATGARAIAATRCGDEGADTWTDEELSTCEPIEADGPACIICRDFIAG